MTSNITNSDSSQSAAETQVGSVTLGPMSAFALLLGCKRT